MNFHEGQKRAWDSQKRIVAVIAGARAGKTSFGAWWFLREMHNRGAGDYLVAAPSYQLIDKAAGPELEYVLSRLYHLGKMRRHPWRFEFDEAAITRFWPQPPRRPPRIIFGHADKPESLAAMEVKAAWLDEAGQSGFKLDSWEEVQRRVAIDEGRILISTTPYSLNWLKTRIHDPWQEARNRGGEHPEIDVITFDSAANPAFPLAEMERALRTLPRWKYDQFYRGKFTRPAGLIYDAFDESKHVIRRCRVPSHWPRYLGVDFGERNTAAVFLAAVLDANQRPTGHYWLYREYYPAQRLGSEEHVRALLEGEPGIPYAVGGSGSEDSWRERFGRVALPIAEPPVRDVEVGIDAVYALFRRNALFVFEDCTGIRDELLSYSRVLNDQGEPTARIEARETYHRADSLRYIASYLERGVADILPQSEQSHSAMARADEPGAGIWLEEGSPW